MIQTLNSKNLKKNKTHFFNEVYEKQNRYIKPKEIFTNLIKNSEEAFLDLVDKTPNFKGIIDIEIVSNNDYIVIKLSDNGKGILLKCLTNYPCIFYRYKCSYMAIVRNRLTKTLSKYSDISDVGKIILYLK